MADEYGGVIPELKMKNFKNVNGSFKVIHPKMKGKKGGLIVFYHHWCGYCQMLAPEFKKLGQRVNKNYMIGAVHGSDIKNSNHLLFETMGMQGVPDIRFVDKNGRVSQEQYQGERKVEDFTRYIKDEIRKNERLSRKDDVAEARRRGIIKKGGAKKKVVKKRVVKKRVVKKKPVKRVKKKTIKKRVVKKKTVKRKVGLSKSILNLSKSIWRKIKK